MKKLYTVQYLRAIAAILVVYSHAIDLQQMFGSSMQQGFFYLPNIGSIGVDIFFVISGFIIAYISRNEHGIPAAKDFMLRRIIRIVPAYYISSLFRLIILALGAQFIFPLKTVIKTLTIIPLFDYGPNHWPNLLGLGWTLSFEFLFYILYVILIALAVKKKDLCLVLIVVSLFLLGILFPAQQLQWLFVTNPMVLEFAFGVMIAMVYKSSRHIPRLLSGLLIALGMVSIFLLVFYDYGLIWEAAQILAGKLVLQRVVLWGIPSALLVAGSIWMEKTRAVVLPENKLLAFLGDASYSIYLAHPICFALMGAVIKRFPAIMKIPGDILIFIYLLSGIICGVLFHLYIEKKVIKKLNRMLSRTKHHPA